MKKNNRFWITFGIVAVAVIALIAVAVLSYFGIGTNRVSRELTVAEAQTLVDATFDDIPKATAQVAKHILENTTVTVDSVKGGDEKRLVLTCTYSTYNVKEVLLPELDSVFSEVYSLYRNNEAAGKKTNATKVNLAVRDSVQALLQASTLPKLSGQVDIEVYEVSEGEFQVFLDDEMVNRCTGGLLDVVAAVENTTTVVYGGKTVDIRNLTTLRTGIADSLAFKNYSRTKPATGTAFKKAVDDFLDEFRRNFIDEGRWMYLVQGLGTTLAITGLSALAGAILGFLVAVIRCTNESTGKLTVIDRICRVYLTVIRGTPLMVQLLIFYFVFLLPIGTPKFLAAVICFSLNSGAYVAEIVRGGIMSVDKGQMEAGRSLGFGYAATMYHFIVPQAFKAVLPSLANEFITLLKESSVAFYIGVADLTQAGLKIRSLTFSNFLPLVAVALIYLVLVLVLTRLVGVLERRLRKSEH